MKKRLSPKTKKAVKITAVVLLCLLGLYIARSAYLLFHAANLPDIPPFDDSALALNKPNLKEGENGYNDLNKLLSDCDKPPLRDLLVNLKVNSEPTDNQAAYLNRSIGKHVANIAHLMQNKTIFAPTMPVDFKAVEVIPYEVNVFKNWIYSRHLSKAWMTLAWHDYNNSNTTSAIKRIEFSLHLGHSLQNSYGDLQWYFFGGVIISDTESTINSLIDKGRFNQDELKIIYALLEKFAVQSPEAYRNAWKAEYTNKKQLFSLFCAPSKEKFWPKRVHDDLYIQAGCKKNMTNKLYFDFYSGFIKHANFDPAAEQAHISATMKRVCSNESMDRNARKGNKDAEDIFCAGITFIPVYYDRFHQRRVNVSALETKIALLRYKNDHGKLPDTLNELVPAYLKAIPKDPFGGKPLRYNPKKNIIYSIGFNIKDDGGGSKKDLFDVKPSDIKKEKDLVLSILPKTK